jgi:hypothetical protein
MNSLVAGCDVHAASDVLPTATVEFMSPAAMSLHSKSDLRYYQVFMVP